MKRKSSALINRRNWQDTRDFLTYRRRVKQNSPGTLKIVRIAMDNLLEWATATPLPKAPRLDPTFPAHLAETGNSVAYRKKLLGYAALFFSFARLEWERYEVVDRHWIDSLTTREKPGTVQTREIYTVEDLLTLTSLEPTTLTDARDIAAVAFLFLSGMRVGAFTTLPLKAIHWEQRPVMLRQWPALGVKTKNRKAYNSYLLTHPDLDPLEEIVRSWAQKTEKAVGNEGMFYAVLTPDRQFDPVQIPGQHRGATFARRLRGLCQRTGLDYLSPHKLRHGHVVWALKRCQTIAHLKAVSENIGHSSIATTDRIYARLVQDDIAAHIASLGQVDDATVMAMARALFGSMR